VFARRHILVGFGITALAALAALYIIPGRNIGHPALPTEVSDTDFWKIITEFSEAGGYFRSDNFVSNESAFQHVIPDMKKQIKPGGVYLGVGPDQNFTYIAAIRPALAFITDIRRQNMLQHLMYKALFELSDTRAEFLSKLFARPIDLATSKTLDTEGLFDVLRNTAPDSDLARENLAAILSRLREEHHFGLAVDDSKNIEFVYNAFVAGGPEIRYSYPNQYAWRRFPSYWELMVENDGTGENGGGENHSYMASDENFRLIKRLESENRIIPIVGDFAGEKALRSVGRYLIQHGSTVSAFYTSNVEFYLFQTEDWKKFFNNVAALPVGNDSLFIRSYFNNYGSQFPNASGSVYSPASYTFVDSMPGMLAAFQAGRIHAYFDVIRRSTP
jgi:hypothetical protein